MKSMVLNGNAWKVLACACAAAVLAFACTIGVPQAHAADGIVAGSTQGKGAVVSVQASKAGKVRGLYKKVLGWADAGTHQFAKVYSRYSDHSNWWREYVVRDIDRNGTTDLFVRAGYSEADSLWYGYTVKKGKIKFLGKVAGAHTGLCSGKKGKTYAWAMHRGVNGYTRIKLSGGKLKSVKKESVVDYAELAGYPKATKFAKKRKIKLLNMYRTYDMTGINKVKAK